MASAGSQGERARLTSARRVSTGPPRATRSAPRSTSPAARNVSTPTATQHKRREQQRQRVIAARAPDQRRHQGRRRRDRQQVDQPRAPHQDQRGEQHSRREPPGAQRYRPRGGDQAVRQDRASRFPLGPREQRRGPDPGGRADAQRRRAQPSGFRCDEQDAVTRAGARVAEPDKLGPLIAAKTAAGQDDEQRQRRDRASAREQQPLRRRARLGARFVQCGERRAQAELAPGQQQAGLRAGQPVLGAGQLPPVQPSDRERRQPAVRPVQAAQSRQRFQSGDICGHEHRRGTRVGRHEPEGDRRAQRRRADDLDTDADRGQGRRDRAAPASSIGQRSGRQGPSRPSAAPGSHRPSGAIAAGRTTTPSSRTGFISTTSVCDPRPSPRSRARAWSATPGLTAPCQVTRTSVVQRRCPVEHRSGALVARDLRLCRHAHGERRRERDTQRGQQPPGRTPPARAAASISGATSPASYAEGADSAGRGAAWLVGRSRAARPQRRDIARPHCRTHADAGRPGRLPGVRP